MIRDCISLLVALALLLEAFAQSAHGIQPGHAVEERILAEAGLATDGPALLEFLRRRTLGEESLAHIKELVARLGDPSFKAREAASAELIVIGKPAVRFLRQATKSNDPEVARRAEDCLHRVEQSDKRPGLAGVVARLLAIRHPPDASKVLLDYLPLAENEHVADEVRSALTVLAARPGSPDPVLRAALVDALPVKRAAAGVALARTKDDSIKKQVEALLEDRDLAVRVQVALALAASHERAAIPVLIDLLKTANVSQASLVEDFLWQIAGDHGPTVALTRDETGRKRCHEAWLAWWQKEGRSLDLKKLEEQRRLLGYTLLVFLDEGRAVELDKEDKPRLRFNGLEFPLDAQMLPGDRILVAEHRANRVTERDATGQIVWQHPFEAPLVAQRLPNGNTFLASSKDFLEVDRNGKEILKLHPQLDGREVEQIMKACKLPLGEIACVTSQQGAQGRFVRFDAKGKELATFPVNVGTMGGRLDVTPAGRVLVPEKSHNRIAEYDPAGQITWTADFPLPVAAVRLPNGNVLVTSYQDNRAIELNRDGKEVWEFDAQKRVTRAFRR